MQFLRTVFWVVLAVVAVIFAFNNWVVVSVHLWGDLILDSPLPVLLLVAFLLGLLPALLLYRATRWSLNRKLEAATRAFGTSEARPLGTAETRPFETAGMPPPPLSSQQPTTL